MKTLLVAAALVLGAGTIAVAQTGPEPGGPAPNAGVRSGIEQQGHGEIPPPHSGLAGDAPVDQRNTGDPEKSSAERNRPNPADTKSGSVQPGSVGSMGSGSRQ